jgi:hypothetical protein
VNGEEPSYSPNALLIHTTGITPTGGSPQADICHVLASKQGDSSRKGRNFKANETSITADTLKIADTTYFRNKGETITFQGHQYFTHSTMIQYCIGQQNGASNTMPLIDRGANGCVCVDDMLVLEGSECFVYVSGLDGYCDTQLRIVAAQALI